MDQIDSKILRYLLADARVSARKLSLKIGISTVTVLSRIKKMEKSGTIKGYSARLDHEKMGYSLTAIIEIMARKDWLISTEGEIAAMENVCAVYDITGSTDTAVVAKFKSREELSAFVKGLASVKGIESTVTHIVLNTVKEDFRLLS